MVNIIKTFSYIVLISVFLIGCKATKGIKDDGTARKMKTAKIIANHYAKNSAFYSLKAALNINLKTANKEEKLTASLRILKDEKIWMSIGKMGFSGAKLLITPTRVQFYNKIDNTFFDGDFSIISNWLGTELSFQQLQAVLLGESMFVLEPLQYETEVLTHEYLLKPKNQNPLIEHYITINPSNFKLKGQEISQPKSFRILNVDYKSYQEVSKQLLPLLINMTMVEKTSETQIDITYKNISLNQELRFPFKIPSNYKEISFEK